MSKQPHDARNIEFLAKEVKQLKKKHRLHDPEAISVLQSALPELVSTDLSNNQPLHQFNYQTAVARKYGFSDWTTMVSYAKGRPRRVDGMIVISENQHNSLDQALNDRASLHGMPKIGTKLNNHYGLEWTVVDYGFFPTPTTFARYPNDCDFLPVIAPHNVSQRLLDFINETDQCTSKRILFLDTMPDIHPFQLGRDLHCSNYSGNPEESYIYFDFARVHETTFAHEIAHLWFMYVEDGDGCRALNDRRDNGKVNQLDFMQSFVLDLRVNDLIASRGFDMTLVNNAQIHSLTMIRDWIIKGYKPQSSREVLVNCLSIAAAYLEQKRWPQEMKDWLKSLLDAIEAMKPDMYKTAMKFVEIINRHGYDSKAAARASMDACIGFGFAATGDDFDIERDLREPPLNECMQDKQPDFFRALPVSCKLEIGKTIARAGIGRVGKVSLSASPTGSAQIMVEDASGNVVGPLAVNYQLIPYHIIDEHERKQRENRLAPDKYGRLPFEPSYGFDVRNPYGREIKPGMVPDAFGRIAGDPGYNTAYPPGQTPQERMVANSQNPHSHNPMLPMSPIHDYRRQYMAGVGMAVAREQLGRAQMQTGTNLYEYVNNNPVNFIDPSGNAPISPKYAATLPSLSSVGSPGSASSCLSAPPAPSTSPLCVKYGCATYPGTGTNLECFCKCAGDSPWSDEVRGCLACMYAKGVNITVAHAACYAEANKHHGFPFGTIATCLALCSPLPPLPPTGPPLLPIPLPIGRL